MPTDLSQPFGTTTAGPAGFVVWVAGLGQDGASPLTVTSPDGFTMTFSVFGEEWMLVAPNGDSIHEIAVPFAAPLTGLEIDNVVRVAAGDSVTWLDPETGADLVTFPIAQIDEVIAEADSPSPVWVTEAWFSADGTQWTLMDSRSGDESISLTLVGEKEVLLFTESMINGQQKQFLQQVVNVG